MTIAALLSHFGVNNVRYVAVGGEVVFDGVKAIPGVGYVHATHGPVTPVAKHTFHGGEEEPDDDSSSDRIWWDDEAEITKHINAMKVAFPGFAYVPASDDTAPCWIGEINTGRGTFTVGVLLRRDRGLPRIAVVNGPRLGVNAGRNWKRSPHLYDNDNPCVADHSDWDPKVHTAATVTAWAAHWLAAYTLWRITRRWPTEGVNAVVA
jgi:hypothetical protein